MNKNRYIAHIFLWLVAIVLVIKEFVLQYYISDIGFRASSLAVNFCISFFLLIFGFLFKGKKTIWWFFAVDLAVSMILFSDAIYYRSFGMLPSVSALNQTGMLGNFGMVTFSLIKVWDIVFFIDIPFLLIAVLLEKNVARTTMRCFLAYLAFFIIASGSYVLKDVVSDKKSIVGIDVKATTVVVKVLGITGYRVVDAITALIGYDTSYEHITPENQKKVLDWMKWNYENLPANKFTAMFAGKNLIIMQVESLETFQLFNKIGDQEITPELNRLAANGIYFPEFRAQEGAGQTSDGEFMLNSGCYRLKKNTPVYSYPRNKYNSLPLLFATRGYHTYSTHPDDYSTWNWLQVDTNMGYQKCYGIRDFVYDEKIGYGVGDKPFLRQYFEKVKDFQQPFQALVLTLSLHADFDLPEKVLTLKVPEEIRKRYLGKYLQAARYTDEAIAEFVANLDRCGLLDNTVLIIYGDHPSLHKFYQDDVNSTNYIGNWWQQNDHRVPLIIYAKGIKPYRNEVHGGQVDLLPTICSLFAIDGAKYKNSAFGRNLLNTRRDYVLIPGGQLWGKYSDGEKEKILEGSDLSDLAVMGNMWGLAEKPKK